MSRYKTEFSRLYGVTPPALAEFGPLVATDGTVKAMVLELSKPADWMALSAVWQAAQNDWDLPATAVAVSGVDGLQLWFSVSEPVKAEDAADFLAALRTQYLGAVPDSRICIYPSSEPSGTVVQTPAIPSQHADTGNWSAFVSPDLVAVFGEQPWLDVQPNPDQQADILSRLASIKASQFYDVLHRLKSKKGDETPAVESNFAPPSGQEAPPKEASAARLNAKEFLLQIMNDPQVALTDRIEAAKALLHSA
ncbi:MAG: hypothetical protein EAZ11_09695 [Curvibacter sp.]|nr:MAG: hypothetical protein EAZ11_09695 [Curvibacter sp.]